MRFLCEPGCSNMGESCSRSTDCCNAECVDGSCAAACGADALGVSMVKSWFDKPIHENIASPSHLFLDAYDLRRKRLYDLDQRLINHDGDPSTPALGASHPAWLYYRQGLLAPGSPVDDGDANHALTFFQTPYRGSTITGFLGTEDGPDMIISEDSPSLEVRDFLAAINDGVVEHTDWLGRIQSIEIHEPPYLKVQGVWQPQGIATIKVTAATSGPSPAGAVRVTEAVLDAVPFPAATGPLHSCGGIEVAGSFSMHWGPVTALEDLYVLPANADGRWDSSIPWDTQGSQ